MTDYSVPSGVKDAVDSLVANSTGVMKLGINAAEGDDDFNYGEAKAEELGNFNVTGFISNKGLEGKYENKNQRLLIYDLENDYSVPKDPKASALGGLGINFSSKIQEIGYDELSERFIWLYTAPKLRRLSEAESVLSQITKDREILRRRR